MIFLEAESNTVYITSNKIETTLLSKERLL